jgi:hypothetical protein
MDCGPGRFGGRHPEFPFFSSKNMGSPPPSPQPPQPAVASERTGPSRSPKCIAVRIKQPLETLIAGESGSFELEARLTAAGNAFGGQVQWDREAEVPLVIYIAAPEGSGIAFIDRIHPDRPYRHILVKFNHPSGSDSQPLTAKVDYIVNPRTSAGSHSFWMDIYGELVDATGLKIQDMGVYRLPFEIDTHLKTKVLMLTIIAVAVFLFIVEWVRVDVVAIAMMVLLPELGLLNARDTFKGLSSNAVVAIIGVMIISYGLNRAGLVGKTIKEIRFRETFGLNALAIHQSDKAYYRQLADRPLQAGDAVLLHGTWEQLHALEDLHRNLIIITPFEKEFHKPEKAVWASVCFMVTLGLMILSSFYFQSRPYNPIPLSVCLMLGAVGMVLTRVISINEAYRSVDWRTVSNFSLAVWLPR